MKTTIILHDNIKQVVFTPENETEKQALKMFSPNDNISLAIKEGSFYGYKEGAKPFSVDVAMCQGGYMRAWDSSDSVILVLTPKEAQPKP